MTQAYPLQWPQGRSRRSPSERKPTRFHKCGSTLTVAEAMKRLLSEIERIGARYPVISSNVETRRDGFPRSGAPTPQDPAVAAYFELSGQPHCLPCDTYTTVAGNIAAIAAHIEATRAIERHGVASVREMFTGFVALPAPKKWWDILQVRSDASRDVIEANYRRLARDRHPDRGGSDADMAELNGARDTALREAP